MVTLRDVFEERVLEFEEGYGFYEQDEALGSLAITGEMLDLMFGEREATLAMTALSRVVKDGWREFRWADLDGVKVDADWRKVWADLEGYSDATSKPLFFEELHDLHAFAFFGIIQLWSFSHETLDSAPLLRARWEASRQVPEWIEAICQKIDRLEALVGDKAQERFPLHRVRHARTMARARLKLDSNQPLTVHELAVLSGVTTKRLQNAVYAKTDEAPTVDRNGLIAPESCLPWLDARDYRHSIWKQVVALWPLREGWGEDMAFDAADAPEAPEDFVFVPVANDGSVFGPALARPEKKGGKPVFTIGPKGGEEPVEDFAEALKLLQAMPTPRWRRPNPESGNWGIVSGQSWKRVRVSELDRLPS